MINQQKGGKGGVFPAWPLNSPLNPVFTEGQALCPALSACLSCPVMDHGSALLVMQHNAALPLPGPRVKAPVPLAPRLASVVILQPCTLARVL